MRQAVPLEWDSRSFTDRIATYRLRIVDGQLWLDPKANPLGNTVTPVHLGPAT